MSEEENEKIIASAFNAGYLMDKHEPQLLDKILKSNNPKSEYIQALASGKKQHEREKIIVQQERIKELSQQKKRHR